MHPNPDVLALLALGEEAGTPAERAHVESCAQCQAEIADLARAVVAGREGRVTDSGLVAPPDRVWSAIRAELGFGGTAVDGVAYGSHGLREIATRTAQPRRAGVERNGSDPGHEGVDAPAEPPHRPAPTPVAEARPEPEPPVPPAGLGARTPGVADLDAARTARSRGRRYRAVAVAAALALLVGAGIGFGLDRVLSRQTILWTADLQAQTGFTGSTGRAEVVQDRQGNRTLRVELDAPIPVDGSREVWLIDRDVRLLKSVGYLTGDRGQWPIPADLDPTRFPVVDVSKEPENDSELAHSGTSIVRGTLNT